MRRLSNIDFRIPVVVIVLFLAMAGGVYLIQKKYYSQMSDALLNEFFAPAQKVQAQFIAEQFEGQINKISDILKVAAEYRNLHQISSVCREDQAETLESLFISLKDIADHISLIDQRGTVICAPNLKEMEGINIAKLPHIQEALISQRGVISRIFENPLGVKLIAVNVPIFSDKGEFLGLLGAAVNVEIFEKRLTSEPSFTKSAYNVLIDDDDTIIYHPDISLVGERVFGEKVQAATKKNQDLNNIFKKILAGETGYGFYVYKGENKTVGYAPVELIGNNRFWSVAVTAKSEEYKNITASFFKKIASINLLLIFWGFVLIVIAVYLTRMLSAPAQIERERESKKKRKIK